MLTMNEQEKAYRTLEKLRLEQEALPLGSFNVVSIRYKLKYFTVSISNSKT